MATINFATREISTKLVYVGASSAGCNTNVRQLHKLVTASEKSRLHQFGPGDTEERSFYFDYVGTDADRINSFDLLTRVYSLPGGLTLKAHRDEVMRDLDALVVVADARPGEENSNMDHLIHLEQILSEQGLELSALPVILQVNHCDATDARPTEDVVYDLNPYGFEVVDATAINGRGVKDTHLKLMGNLGTRIHDNMAGNAAALSLTAIHRATRLRDDEVIRKHIEVIQTQTTATPASSVGGDTDTPSGPAPTIEVAFQPRAFIGSHPCKVLGTKLDNNQVRVTLLMQPMSGGETRQLTVVLANRPTDTPAAPRHQPPHVTSAHSAPTGVSTVNGDHIRDYLPDSYTPAPAEGFDLPSWVYGAVGIGGGVVIGVLGAFLVGMV